MRDLFVILLDVLNRFFYNKNMFCIGSTCVCVRVTPVPFPQTHFWTLQYAEYGMVSLLERGKSVYLHGKSLVGAQQKAPGGWSGRNNAARSHARKAQHVTFSHPSAQKGNFLLLVFEFILRFTRVLRAVIGLKWVIPLRKSYTFKPLSSRLQG